MTGFPSGSGVATDHERAMRVAIEETERASSTAEQALAAVLALDLSDGPARFSAANDAVIAARRAHEAALGQLSKAVKAFQSWVRTQDVPVVT